MKKKSYFIIDEIKSEFSNSEVNYEIVVFSEASLEKFKNNSKSSKMSLVGFQLFSAIMDGDGQNPPKEILKLLNLFNENFNNCDVVSGIRVKK